MLPLFFRVGEVSQAYTALAVSKQHIVVSNRIDAVGWVRRTICTVFGSPPVSTLAETAITRLLGKESAYTSGKAGRNMAVDQATLFMTNFVVTMQQAKERGEDALRRPPPRSNHYST